MTWARLAMRHQPSSSPGDDPWITGRRAIEVAAVDAAAADVLGHVVEGRGF